MIRRLLVLALLAGVFWVVQAPKAEAHRYYRHPVARAVYYSPYYYAPRRVVYRPAYYPAYYYRPRVVVGVGVGYYGGYYW